MFCKDQLCFWAEHNITVIESLLFRRWTFPWSFAAREGAETIQWSSATVLSRQTSLQGTNTHATHILHPQVTPVCGHNIWVPNIYSIKRHTRWSHHVKMGNFLTINSFFQINLFFIMLYMDINSAGFKVFEMGSENSTVTSDLLHWPVMFDPWTLGSELRLCPAPGGAATGGAGRPVAMEMRRANQRPAGIRWQLQLEKCHLCGAANASTTGPVSSAGQRLGR